SVAFLRTLFAAPDRVRLLLIITHRSEAPHEPPALVELAGALDATRTRVIPVGPLEAGTVRALTRAIFARSEAPIHEGLLDAVAEEAQGSPFLAMELALRGVERTEDVPGREAVRVADAISARAAQLPDEARRLLELVAVAGHPVDE